MSIETHFDQETRIATITISGTVTYADFQKIVLQVSEQPEYWQFPRRMWDLRESEFTLSRTEVRRLADMVRDGPSTAGRLALVTSNAGQFDAARAFEIWRGDASVEVHVFRDIDDAKVWLAEYPGSP